MSREARIRREFTELRARAGGRMSREARIRREFTELRARVQEAA